MTLSKGIQIFLKKIRRVSDIWDFCFPVEAVVLKRAPTWYSSMVHEWGEYSVFIQNKGYHYYLCPGSGQFKKIGLEKKKKKTDFLSICPGMCCAVFHCLQLGVIDWVTMSAFIWGLGLQNSFKIYI